MNQLNELSGKIIELSIKIHRTLGPGLLESAYHRCLEYELNKENIAFISDEYLPVRYENLIIDNAYKPDLIVDQRIILELKSVERITDIHKAQLLTYLKLSDYSLGLLINFREPLLKNGIHRFINTQDYSSHREHKDPQSTQNNKNPASSAQTLRSLREESNSTIFKNRREHNA